MVRENKALIFNFSKKKKRKKKTTTKTNKQTNKKKNKKVNFHSQKGLKFIDQILQVLAILDKKLKISIFIFFNFNSFFF